MAGAYGNYSWPFLPYIGGQYAGIRTDFGTMVPPAANVHYVRSTGVADYDPPELTGRIFADVNTALKECRSGRGDWVFVLPGHAESFGNNGDIWNNMVNGTRIVGLGYGSMRPTFTFTHANAQFDIDTTDCMISNCVFTISGTTTVANPFNVTVAGFQFINNECMVGSSSTCLATDFIKLNNAAATDCKIIGNFMYSTTDAAITTILTTTGANDRLEIIGNVIQAAQATAASGALFDLSNAAIVQNNIMYNAIWNNTASSKYVIKPHASSTGWVHGNVWGVGDSGTAPASAGWTTYTTGYRFGINQCITTTAASALLSPAVDS